MEKTKKRMKPATKIKLILVGMALCLVGAFFMLKTMDEAQYKYENQATVTVKDGVADPSGFNGTLKVEKDGKFRFIADWGDWENYDPALATGFITAVTVKDSSGTLMFETSGESLHAESVEMDLTAGEYALEFKFLGSKETFDEYCMEEGFAVGGDSIGIFKDGTWDRTFTVKAKEVTRNAYIFGVTCGLTFGLLLVALIATLGTMGRKEGGPKYDERQIAEQGKAYKYGFFTGLIMCSLHLIFDLVGVDLHIDKSVMLFLIIVIPVCVSATHMILHDAYFQLNENKRFLIICLAAIGILNLVFAVKEIASGTLLVNGVLTFMKSTNLFSALMMFYIILITGIKSYLDKKED